MNKFTFWDTNLVFQNVHYFTLSNDLIIIWVAVDHSYATDIDSVCILC